MIEADRPSLSRATAAGLVAAIALVSLALNLWELRADLPAVLHSDYIQVEQAVDLLSRGSVEDRAAYPLPLVYLYAAAGAAAFAVGRVLGWDGYADWPSFVQHLSQPQVHHAIGRVVNAVCAALLALGVYRLARVRFDRRVAVLAAAIAAFSPLETIYAHQVRPHVPVVTLIVLVAPAVLRAALTPTLRTGLLSGLAAGVASAVFPVGLPFACAAVTLAVLVGRPLRALATTLPALGLGFAVGWAGLFALATKTGWITPGSHESGMVLRGEGGSLGYGIADIFSKLERFLHLGPYWLAAETMCALAFLGFAGLCLARRRRWRDLLLYGVPASAMAAGMCFVHVARPRYTMYVTPFLAALAASAALAIPHALLRRLAVGLLVLVPLASSIRHDVLLGRSDTRIATREAVDSLSKSGLRVVVQADILPSAVGTPQGARLFPPNSDYRPWMRARETPRETFQRMEPDIFVRRRNPTGQQDIEAADLRSMDFELAALIGSDASFIPDDPEWVLSELWRADRPGPSIDVLARKELVERVRATQVR